MAGCRTHIATFRVASCFIEEPVHCGAEVSPVCPATKRLMLQDFFKLNAPHGEWASVDAFKSDLKKNDHIAGMQYSPDDLKKAAHFRSIENKTFQNVSFSKTKIEGLTFRGCRFEDCLFIGVDFVNCEFHHCAFKCCNLYKSSFERTYIDPDAFLFAIDPSSFANIGVGLFQSLSRDLANQNQHSFRAKAEFLFEKWIRYQLRFEMEQQRISRFSYKARFFWRYCMEVTTGYGWKPARLIRTIVVLYCSLLLLNFLLWNFYAITSSPPSLSAERSFVNDVYYTSTLLTTLGPMGLTPTSSIGLFVAAIHGIIGVLFFALLASLMFRLVVKTT